ncbi:MAG: sugar kinase [Desulfobacteraceae bacterium]|nr:sugar kinase [Desulfobacteraceae bacterium]
MFAVVGTVPDEDFPLVCGQVFLSGRDLVIEGRSVTVNRGTPALLASALQVCEFFDADYPAAYLAGDIGRGHGSREIYAYLEQTLCSACYTSLTFHYIQPDVDWHNRVLFAVEEMKPRPVLIADAGFMYAAKMSGQAGSYDLFTPDIGELAFLADSNAPHPFYTRGFIFHEPERAEELIAGAYEHHNAARYLLVKGKRDLAANEAGVAEAVEEPLVPAMEAIGGTGDIITGIVAALTGLGYDVLPACVMASRVTRLAGQMANPDPGTQVIEIIEQISAALEKAADKSFAFP